MRSHDRPDPDEAEQLAASIAMSPSLTFSDRERVIEILRWVADHLRDEG